jgi:hypothetical protein
MVTLSRAFQDITWHRCTISRLPTLSTVGNARRGGNDDILCRDWIINRNARRRYRYARFYLPLLNLDLTLLYPVQQVALTCIYIDTFPKLRVTTINKERPIIMVIRTVVLGVIFSFALIYAHEARANSDKAGTVNSFGLSKRHATPPERPNCVQGGAVPTCANKQEPVWNATSCQFVCSGGFSSDKQPMRKKEKAPARGGFLDSRR